MSPGARSRSGTRRRRLLVAAAVLGATGLGLIALDRRPLHLRSWDASDPEAGGVFSKRDLDSPYLLVTSGAARRADEGFDQGEWSEAWVNLFEQELGHYAHSSPVELTAGSFARRDLVAIAHDAQARLTGELRSRAEDFVSQGGVLILERPDASWSRLSGIRLRDEEHDPTLERVALSNADQRILGARVLDEMRALPLPARLHSLEEVPDKRISRLLHMDHWPALVSSDHGEGKVLSLGFDLGRLLLVLQQGAPTAPDYSVHKRWGFYDYILESHDLVWDEAYLENEVPAADVLERCLLRAARLQHPLPSWWGFPDRAPGLLLMTHDEDLQAASSCELLLEHELETGSQATYFLIAPRRISETWPPEAVRRFAKAGADLQLHWNRFPMANGIWKLEPFAYVHSLADQIDSLNAALLAGGSPELGSRELPLINRNHYLMWDASHFTRPFRELAQAGVAMDSTYGPNRGARGYLFATGRPFFPLDVDGSRFDLRELPFVSQEDWGGENEAWFRRMFAASESRYHCAIACIFHPHLIVREESGARLWKAVGSLAEQYGHTAITFSDYLRFLEARRASALRTQRLEDGAYAIELDAAGAGLALSWQTLNGQPLKITLDGQPWSETSTLRVDGIPQLLIAIPPGRHTLIVHPAAPGVAQNPPLRAWPPLGED